ncbi:hypothetical protein SLEP1_g26009 [Rubroshorea leprosula]|uniref:HMA domain-containing protein n=1 Tax=Rubroshorea leprosula TaxID=152421 RepID=A0AAV5JNP7_9ROSI|nr:hypothetical protein SLEP1_g26009 [Rubroshorea leprosula]
MVLNVVDLQCSKCYKKIKKLLCKFPEIRDQEYDEKANKVTIKVVSCSPEKMRDKLCCKGCGCIKSIEIKEPTPPPPPPPPPTPPKEKHVEVSVDLQVQGFCYCKCCSGWPWALCYCGCHVQCVVKTSDNNGAECSGPTVLKMLQKDQETSLQISWRFVIVNAVADGLGAHVTVAGKSNAFCVMGDPFATAGAVVEKLNQAAQSCKY